MKRSEFKQVASALQLIITLSLLSFCASKPGHIGKWKEVGRTATIEFSRDGTFKAVDNQGMAVSGKYTLSKDGHLQCEIQQEKGTAEVVNLIISVKGDELMLTSPGDTKTECYRRER